MALYLLLFETWTPDDRRRNRNGLRDGVYFYKTKAYLMHAVAGTCTIPAIFLLAFFNVSGESLSPNGCPLFVIDTSLSCKDSSTRLPCGWRGLKKDVSMFSLREEHGIHFIRNSARNTATAIGKAARFDTRVTPYVRWRWRVRTLPAGGKENDKRKADSGAGVYIIFEGAYPFKPLIKYAWSATLPRGTVTRSPFYFNVKIIVLRSGPGDPDTWVDESVNVYEDFNAIFHRLPPVVEGIAIMTDADNTNSFAEADYGGFFASGCR